VVKAEHGLLKTK